jgi:hypothetical protein
MTVTQIFIVQIAVSLLVFGLAARWYALPRVNRLPLVEALTLLILPHALRTLGLAFLVPGSGVSFFRRHSLPPARTGTCWRSGWRFSASWPCARGGAALSL